MSASQIRWSAAVYYATENGIVDVMHDLAELEDLHLAVERGPHWDTIDRIVIVRAKKKIAGLTVEAAEKL